MLLLLRGFNVSSTYIIQQRFCYQVRSEIQNQSTLQSRKGFNEFDCFMDIRTFEERVKNALL